MAMKLTVWGARGSVPTPGAEYVRYGGDTTCMSLETEDGSLIVLDAGTGLRRLGCELIRKPPRRIAFLLSHAPNETVQDIYAYNPTEEAFPLSLMDSLKLTHVQPLATRQDHFTVHRFDQRFTLFAL